MATDVFHARLREERQHAQASLRVLPGELLWLCPRCDGGVSDSRRDVTDVLAGLLPGEAQRESREIGIPKPLIRDPDHPGVGKDLPLRNHGSNVAL